MTTAELPAEVTALLKDLRDELARLSVRVEALEAASPRTVAVPAATAQPARPWPALDPGISDEVLLVISAAIAAFLGKRPHIRSVRVLSSASWAHQGRVSIQARSVR
jgi:methylmalonyl-CoA carboxyltransferase large subunit